MPQAIGSLSAPFSLAVFATIASARELTRIDNVRYLADVRPRYMPASFATILARAMSSSAGHTSQDLCPVRSMQSEQVAWNCPITVRNQDGQLVRNLANEIKINRNVILSFPEHEARVLEAPLNIGNDEVRPGRCFRSSHVNLHWNRQVVRLAE